VAPVATSVLVVDDSPLVRLLAGKALASMGCEASFAEDGRQALDVLDPGIDVALVDLNMPVMDGPSLIRAIRERDDLGHLKVVLMSATDESDGAASAEAFGTDAFLMKPFDGEQLTRLLGELVA
jgi:CheY-like chemotaxis protein